MLGRAVDQHVQDKGQETDKKKGEQEAADDEGLVQNAKFFPCGFHADDSF
jgi:hypothetical protein